LDFYPPEPTAASSEEPPAQVLASTDPIELALINEVRDKSTKKDAREKALSELYALYHNELIGYLRFRCPVKREIEDVAQEAWRRVFEKIDEFDHRRAPFVAFLKHCAQIAALRWHRAQRSHLCATYLMSDLSQDQSDWSVDEILVDAVRSWRNNPEEEFAAQQRYTRLLDVTFAVSNPPHQLLAFVFCKLLSWTPTHFVARLADLELIQIEEQLQKTLMEEMPFEADSVRRAMRHFRGILQKPFEEAIRDPGTRYAYANLRSSIVGETRMRDYFRKDPEQNVSHWIFAVRRRTAAACYEKGSD